MKRPTWMHCLIDPRASRAACLAVAAMGALACGNDSLLSPRELVALSRAESLWTARPFADYTYEYQQLCFCPPDINQWTRLTVRGGNVVAAIRVDSGTALPADQLQMWTPIDSLFTRLRLAATQGNSGAYSDVIVEFDPTLGYPTYAEWREKPNVADAGVVYRLRNVKPIQ